MKAEATRAYFMVGSRFACVALLLSLSLGPPSHVSAQASEGSTASAVGAGALGAYSGAVFGLAAALGPCNRLLSGPVCPRSAAAVGGVVGMAAGVVLGDNDTARFNDRMTGAGYGALVGGVVGLGLSQVVRQYGWPDPLAFAAVGAAIGTAPEASALGFFAGSAVGALGWFAFPRATVGDAIAVAVVGLAVGGLVGWVSEARNSRSGPATVPALVFSVPFQIPVP